MTNIKNKLEELEGLIGEKAYLKEAKKVDEKTIEKVADLTDKNNHLEARQELALAMKRKELAKAYGAMITLNDFFGYVNDIEDAYKKLDKMLKKAIEEFDNSEDIFKAL